MRLQVHPQRAMGPNVARSIAVKFAESALELLMLGAKALEVSVSQRIRRIRQAPSWTILLARIFRVVHSFPPRSNILRGGSRGYSALRLRRVATRAATHLRAIAAKMLGTIGDDRAVEALVSVLENEPAPEELRTEVVTALGFIGDSRAVDALLSMLSTLSNTAPDLARQEAATALAKTGDARTSNELLKVARSDAPDWVRENCRRRTGPNEVHAPHAEASSTTLIRFRRLPVP